MTKRIDLAVVKQSQSEKYEWTRLQTHHAEPAIAALNESQDTRYTPFRVASASLRASTLRIVYKVISDFFFGSLALPAQLKNLIPVGASVARRSASKSVSFFVFSFLLSIRRAAFFCCFSRRALSFSRFLDVSRAIKSPLQKPMP
jgi:hypothetical protein